MNMIEHIKADRDTGTDGPWIEWHGQIGTENTCVVESNSIDTGQTDINRIARVPDMEAALIAAEELAEAYVALCEMTGRDFHTHDGSRYAAYKTAIGDTK